MSIRVRVTCAVAAVLAAFTCVVFSIEQIIVFPQFLALENDEAVDDLRRCREAIVRELHHLSTFTNDWSAWDDSYHFVQDRNEAYIEANLSTESFKSAKKNLSFYINTEGHVVHSKVLDLDTEEDLKLRGFPEDTWPLNHPLLAHDSVDSAIECIQNTEKGPILLCSRPIVKSSNEGPIVGTLIFGRLLTDEIVERLNAQTRVAFHVWPVDSDEIADADLEAMQRLQSDEQTRLESRGTDMLAAYGLLPDLHGQPALLLRADVPRSISREGRMATRFAGGSLVLASIVLLAMLMILLQTMVIGPVRRLTRHAIAIGASGDLTRSSGIARNDEIGLLAKEFDGMVQRLAESRAKLADTSRQAGMADVASGMLHNVGNVLNNVNVSTAMINDTLRQSRVSGLAKATDLLRKNAASVADFLTADEKGKQIPGYLAQISEALVSEHASMLRELEVLRTSLDHVNQIIQSQHAFTRAAGHVEPASMSQVIDTALSIMEAGFKRHGVRIERDVADFPAALLDKAKLLQIMVNLLTNAKDAVGALPEGERLIRVRCRLDGDRIIISVTDNGIGILPEHQTRVFANGFTTKTNGRGYGLHYSANAARELGGALSLHSEGHAKGATLTLDLPYCAGSATIVEQA